MPDTPRSAVSGPIAFIFGINTQLLVNALAGLSEQDFVRRPTSLTNSAAWIAGHAIQTRAMILGLLGDPVETGWGAIFNRGAEPPSPDSLPTREAMLSLAADIATRLQAKLADLDDAALSADAHGPKLPGVKSVTQMLSFFALHDTYHVGQLAYIRKALAYPQLVG